MKATASPAVDPATFAPRRVLFVLSGLIGDSVMSLPAIAAARELWPGAEISVLGKKHNRELISACGFFDEFRECNADPFSLRRSAEVVELEHWLKEKDFDAALVLLGDQFAHLLARAGIPVRVGVRGTRLQNCLTHTYDIGSPRTWGVRERLGALRCLGYGIDDRSPELVIDPEADRSAAAKLSELGLEADGKYIAVHPFGSTKRQWWALEKVEKLSEAMSDKQLQTVLVGGSEVSLSSGAGSGFPIVNTTGKLTLPELIAVIRRAEMVVTTDSGPFHIAGALGRPIVGVFRSRRPEHAEQYRNTEVVFGRDEVCMTRCEWDACRAEPCCQMEDISAEDVIAAVRRRLNKG